MPRLGSRTRPQETSSDDWVVGSQVRSVASPPSSPVEPGISTCGLDRPFVPGFPCSVLAPPCLRLRSRSWVAISAGLSPHAKIPFLAAKARRLTCGGNQTRGWQRRAFIGVVLWWIQAECFELLAPFRRRIRRRSMLMPRARRPSTAALTSLGARKASEIVMLT